MKSRSKSRVKIRKCHARHPHEALWQASCELALRQANTKLSNLDVIAHDMTQRVQKSLSSCDSYEALKQDEMKAEQALMALALAEHNGDKRAVARLNRAIEALPPLYPWEASKTIFLKHLRDLSNGTHYKSWAENAKDIHFSVVSYRIPESAKIGIIGDWGTGANDAKALFSTLLQEHNVDVVIHLGDIYYAGLQSEVLHNFLQPIRDVFSQTKRSVPIFTIPGNHEYYSSGQAFYELLDILNNDLGDDCRQEASYFCLRTENDSWQFLGIDTGYCDAHSYHEFVDNYGIRDDELRWLQHKIETFSGRSVLLSHHPLVSAVEKLDKAQDSRTPYLSAGLFFQLRPLLQKIDLWLWGHEHALAIYKDDLALPENATLQRGRLIGGSARDVKVGSRNARHLSLLQKTPHGLPVQAGSVNGYVNHSYAVMDLADNTTRYFQMPSWHDKSPIALPANQNACVWEETL